MIQTLFSRHSVVVVSWFLFIGGTLGMLTIPVQLVYFKEPIIVLFLSWLAIAITGFNTLVTAYVFKEAGNNG